MWVSKILRGGGVSIVHTKIDANGTLVDFVTHDVGFWVGCEGVDVEDEKAEAVEGTTFLRRERG